MTMSITVNLGSCYTTKMTNERQLLLQLADGNFHSGQDLAKTLGLSRAGVWKRLQQLQQSLEIELYAVSGKGYKLARPLQLLDVNSLRDSLAQIQAIKVKPELEVHLTLDSTNRRALELAKQAPQQSRLILAEKQTAGRGRRGRQWLSPFGRNLYLSLYWWFDVMPESIPTLSLVAGVCLARCLEAFGMPDCQLKWPNDVYYDGKKLAGILLEMQGEATGGCGIVIGMGINLDMPEADAKQIDQPWTDVKHILGHCIDRNKFTAHLAGALLEMLSTYRQEGITADLEAWRQRDVLIGKTVRLALPGETFHGIARGIDDQGALLLEQDGQINRHFSGELSVRLAEQKS